MKKSIPILYFNNSEILSEESLYEKHMLKKINQELANIFYKGPDSKYFQHGKPYGLCHCCFKHESNHRQ